MLLAALFYNISVLILLFLGMVEHDFYTVVFGVSRAVGCLSNGVWSRAFGLPIERPNSIDISFIEKLKWCSWIGFLTKQIK